MSILHWFHNAPVSSTGIYAAAMQGDLPSGHTEVSSSDMIQHGIRVVTHGVQAAVDNGSIVVPEAVYWPSSLDEFARGLIAKASTWAAWAAGLTVEERNAYCMANAQPAASIIAAGWMSTLGPGYGVFEDRSTGVFFFEHVDVLDLLGAVRARGLDFKIAMLSLTAAATEVELDTLRFILRVRGDVAPQSDALGDLMDSFSKTLREEFNSEIEKLEKRGNWRGAMQLSREGARPATKRRYVTLPTMGDGVLTATRWDVLYPWGKLSDVRWFHLKVDAADFSRLAWALAQAYKNEGGGAAPAGVYVKRTLRVVYPQLIREMQRLGDGYVEMRQGEVGFEPSYEAPDVFSMIEFGPRGTKSVTINADLFDVVLASACASLALVARRPANIPNFQSIADKLVPSALRALVQQYSRNKETLALFSDDTKEFDAIARCVLSIVRLNISMEMEAIDSETRAYVQRLDNRSLARQVLMRRLDLVAPGAFIGGRVW